MINEDKVKIGTIIRYEKRNKVILNVVLYYKIIGMDRDEYNKINVMTALVSKDNVSFSKKIWYFTKDDLRQPDFDEEHSIFFNEEYIRNSGVDFLFGYF